MERPFETLVHALAEGLAADASLQLREDAVGEADQACSVNAAFLVALCGEDHPQSARARRLLSRLQGDPVWQGPARFYLDGLERVRSEVQRVCDEDPAFLDRLEQAAEKLKAPGMGEDPFEAAETAWTVLFPEGAGIRGREKERVRAIRRSREVRIRALNPSPLRRPGTETLFTANVLLTVPTERTLQNGSLPRKLRRRLEPVCRELQQIWYDHPVEVGAPPEHNEILYGLRGLNEAAAFEKHRGNLPSDGRLTCLLSVSVTHRGLHAVARDYIREEIRRFGGFEHLHVFAFTESDTNRLGREVLKPAADRYLGEGHPAADFPEMFGVDGEYGRHFSFLKAVAALWQVLVDPAVRATFKIDLDQVFPQERLVAETGASALDHLRTPLWGAQGVDAQERPVDLGLLAGSLVNEGDIHRGLFTPDVRFPAHAPSADELVFFSALPQALSTEAEMTARYGSARPDGRTTCLQRVHVTGGTTGALVDALSRHRPFTPSFMGRAEDQAYLLSSLGGVGPRPAYLHEPGLVMRHDKASFAADAVRSARPSKLLGDDLRILLFSAYARVLPTPVPSLKEVLDPFTGAFISRIPETVVFLRSSLRASAAFSARRAEEGLRLVREGSNRIGATLAFTHGDECPLKRVYQRERRGWNRFYDVIESLEGALERGDGEALRLRGLARRIIRECAIS